MRVETRSTFDRVWMESCITYLKIMENNEMTIKTKKTTTQDQVNKIEQFFLLAWTIGPFGLLVDFYTILLKLIQSS